MNETVRNSENFVGYEYKDVTTTGEMEGVYADGYPNFGWQLDGSARSALGFFAVTLKFKRDRKIRNKAELSRLQRQFENLAGEIENLEKSKTSGAFIASMTIGLAGTALLGGATFSYLGGMIPLMIILAAPGFAGWILPYFIFKKMSAKREIVVSELSEKQYDAIYEVCEKAHAFLP
ncbi:MAG: hypothetical protein LBD58_12540 [Treponema sp.]|jgi:hypothetical protein|nr:hypothetical protein [Treponema sp.]